MSHATQLPNHRYLHDYLEIINRHDLPANVQSTVCHALQHAVTATGRSALEPSLEAE
jgi:hypothetical protein